MLLCLKKKYIDVASCLLFIIRTVLVEIKSRPGASAFEREGCHPLLSTPIRSREERGAVEVIGLVPTSRPSLSGDGVLRPSLLSQVRNYSTPHERVGRRADLFSLTGASQINLEEELGL